MATILKPDVKSYLDIYLFLQDFYSYAKKAQDGFSYESWAQSLGLSSKSYLRFATLGKRKISEELAQKLCNNLQLDETDKEYFLLLTLYSQTTQASQKSLYGKKLTLLLRQNSPAVEIQPPEDIVSNPLCIVLRNLLSFSDIPKTPASLSKILSLTEEHVLELLSQLQKADLAVESGGEWQAVHDLIKVNDKPRSEALLTYHKICLEKAIASQSLPAELRHYRALNIALTSEEYREYLKDLNDFVAKTFTKFESSGLSSRRLYQVNFNLFPWTEPVLKE